MFSQGVLAKNIWKGSRLNIKYSRDIWLTCDSLQKQGQHVQRSKAIDLNDKIEKTSHIIANFLFLLTPILQISPPLFSPFFKVLWGGYCPFCEPPTPSTLICLWTQCIQVAANFGQKFTSQSSHAIEQFTGQNSPYRVLPAASLI